MKNVFKQNQVYVMKCYHGQNINSIKLLLVVKVHDDGTPLFSSITTYGVGLRVFQIFTNLNDNFILLCDVNKLMEVMNNFGYLPLLTSINICKMFKKILKKESYNNTYTSNEIETIKNHLSL